MNFVKNRCRSANATATGQAAKIGEQLQNRQIDSRQAIEVLQKLDGTVGDLPAIADAAHLIAAEIVLPPDLIEGVLHSGAKLVVGGASKSFKTWLLTDMAVSIATGSPWLGFPTRRGRVLYINLEIQPAFFNKRIAAICDAKNVKLESDWLHVWNLRGYAADSADLLPRLQRGIGREKYDADIIDPIYKLLGARDENKAGDIASLLNDVERLTVKTGASAAFGAHYSKGNQASKESIDRIGGSGVFSRDPDSILNFTKHEQDDCFTVETTLRNHPPVEPFVVRWKFPLMQRDDALDPAALKKSKGRPPKYSASDVLEHVSLTEGESTADIRQRVIDETGMSERTFFDLWKELKTAGKISESGNLWTRS